VLRDFSRSIRSFRDKFCFNQPLIAAAGACLLLSACNRSMMSAKPLSGVSFSQSAPTIGSYDFVEVTAYVALPPTQNPFTDVALSGWFELADGSKRWQVEGFCDAEDGRVFRIRFMPPTPGQYKYSVEYREKNAKITTTGEFQALDEHRRGPIRFDAKYPCPFVWE